MEKVGLEPLLLLARHVNGDYGDIDELDLVMNKEAVVKGYRIFSSYCYKGETFWVITEASREYTTILLPCDY
jgi:hypothetical protein